MVAKNHLYTILRIFFCRLFAGFVPRVLWITIGGAIFFGSYDIGKKIAGNCIVPIHNKQ